MIVIIHVTKATFILKGIKALFQVNKHVSISDLLNIVVEAIITVINKTHPPVYINWFNLLNMLIST